MTRRVFNGTAHSHLEWESQPLLRPLARPRRYGAQMILLGFLVGMILGAVMF